ncbi:orotidine-5'-phosphate decarboxylase [Gammaproteobacteria bacterium]|mgnify:FL=1|jgi:orotidine-5'-phosphate decarboxylase|nr:orotidine-5'-phosphate decarboxylase [Gammaproteobacteria bacterium]MDC0420443.1 orotidine-5'-phosphate decarboxylase [Gammaproteobacteria bacterium]|tara:strand:+ start:14 stop:682 length:669 start_codon:yes stop_codon:yes gene_type:complete
MSKTIIVAVDETQLGNFQSVVDSLDSDLCMIKVGSVSFNALGHQAISYASNKGFKIFLDLKLHDIPNTVKKSIKGLVSLPIDMMTIHTSGGLEMMKAAKNAVDGTDIKIFGVTALTSLSDEDTSLIFKRTAAEQVNTMLDLAEQAGIDGVVCSPHELSLVTKRESLLSITPGIRLKDSNDDQNRVMTPKDALKQGANFLVIGRPITEAKNIKEALLEIHNSI